MVENKWQWHITIDGDIKQLWVSLARVNIYLSGLSLTYYIFSLFIFSSPYLNINVIKYYLCV